MHMKNATHARIESIACIVYFGFLIASQAVHPLHCVCCIWQLESACRPMKTDLKVGFQAAVCNAMDAMQVKKLQRTQCMHTKNATHERIESIACVALFALFACTRCVFRCFDWVASRTSIPLHVLRTTAWKPHVGLWVGLCDILLFTSLSWISGSTVRCNVVMSNYAMNNHMPLRRQRPVCQFMSPLWAVIKLYFRSRAWQVITLLLRTFVIGQGHFWNSRKTVI